MKMGSNFDAARPFAQHCEELIARSPRPEEREAQLASWRRDVARELSQELGQILSGGKLEVTFPEPERLHGKDVFEAIGPVAVNSLLRCGAGEHTLLLSFDIPTAIALTECSFGGEGNPPDQVPSQLPRSAAMLIETLAKVIAQAIASVSNPGDGKVVGGDVLLRSESVTRLKPFDPDEPVIKIALTLAMGAFSEWNAILAMPSGKLDAMLPGTGMGAAQPAAGGNSPEFENSPFPDLPLRLGAVLSEIEMTLDRLEHLSVGDQIALPMPKEIPLFAGDRIVAHGAIGSIDNRMALRLTRFPEDPSKVAA